MLHLYGTRGEYEDMGENNFYPSAECRHQANNLRKIVIFPPISEAHPTGTALGDASAVWYGQTRRTRKTTWWQVRRV